MLTIHKTEWYRLRRNPDEKDFSKQVVYTFKDTKNCHIDDFKDDELDSIEVLIDFLMEKTGKNNKLSYQIVDEELGEIMELRDGKKWRN